MEKGVSDMGFMDLPIFILNELSSGPYGPYVTQRLAEVQKWYEIYVEILFIIDVGCNFVFRKAD